VTRRNWALFAALCVIWGIPYLLIRVAVRDMTPGTLVFLRTAIGGLILLPLALRGGGFGPILHRWRPLVAFTVIEIGIPWLLLSDAERHLSSSVSGLLVAAVPIVGVLVARVAGIGEVTDARRLAGLGLGIGGVAMLVGLDFSHLHAFSLLEIAVVVVGYAVAPVIMARHLADLPSIPVVSASLLLSAIAYLPFAIISPPSNLTAEGAVSIVVLGVVCTALAFLIFFALVHGIGPGRATVITYVNPAVAMLLGVLLLDERFTLGMALGFPLILLGSVLAARTAQSSRTTPDAVAKLAATSPVSPPPSTHSTVMPSSGWATEVPR
jgi:drug/metabolite transporter (DMT)-like permease